MILGDRCHRRISGYRGDSQTRAQRRVNSRNPLSPAEPLLRPCAGALAPGNVPWVQLFWSELPPEAAAGRCLFMIGVSKPRHPDHEPDSRRLPESSRPRSSATPGHQRQRRFSAHAGTAAGVQRCGLVPPARGSANMPPPSSPSFGGAAVQRGPPAVAMAAARAPCCSPVTPPPPGLTPEKPHRPDMGAVRAKPGHRRRGHPGQQPRPTTTQSQRRCPDSNTRTTLMWEHRAGRRQRDNVVVLRAGSGGGRAASGGASSNLALAA